jgi:hypothetical protein
MSYGVDAVFTLFQQHGWDIHAVSAERAGRGWGAGVVRGGRGAEAGVVRGGGWAGYSTVTLLARLRGLSMSRPSLAATW